MDIQQSLQTVRTALDQANAAGVFKNLEVAANVISAWNTVHDAAVKTLNNASSNSSDNTNDNGN